jgi:hypothetical protein
MGNRLLFGAAAIALSLLSAAVQARDDAVLKQYAPAEADYSNIARTNRVTRLGNVWLNTTNWGTCLDLEDPEYPGIWASGCEFPGDSDIELLFAGGLWIGALIDTGGWEFPRVSVGFEGWTGPGNNNFELEPGEAGGQPVEEHGILERSCLPGSVHYSPDAIAPQEFLAVYCDTLVESFWTGMDIIDGPHFPLGLRITQKAMVWDAFGFDDFVTMHFTVENIGNYDLKNLFLAFYIDGDVGWLGEGVWHEDDVTGFLKDSGGEAWNLPYIADNDGRPQAVGSGNDFTCPGVSGIYPLSSLEPVYCSYNWWIPNMNWLLDFGPHWEDDGALGGWTDSLGTPNGDARKYFLMCNGELDYDQWHTADAGYIATHPQNFVDPFTGEISTHPWQLEELSYAADLANGYDTRYLISWGPLGENIAAPGEEPETYLYPGDSLNLAIAYVCGENFHDPDHPQGDLTGDGQMDPLFYDYSDLLYNCTKARFLYQNGYEILPPYKPQNLRITAAPDSALWLAWDTYTTMPTTGVYLYRRLEGQPYGLNPINSQPIFDSVYADGDAILGQRYYYQAQAVRYDSLYSYFGNEVTFIAGAPFAPTGLEARSTNGIIYLAWEANLEPDIARYSINRQDTAGAFQTIGSVPAGDITFTDMNAINGWEYTYAISAVDDDGIESDLSASVSEIPMGLFEDLLVVLERPSAGFLEWPDDSLDAFYQQLFADIGESPEYVFIPTTSVVVFPALPEISSYKILWLIHDAHAMLSQNYAFNRDAILMDYVANGGKVIISGRRIFSGCFGATGPPGSWLTMSGTYPTGELLRDYFRLDSVYLNFMFTPLTPSDYMAASPSLPGYPELQVDTSKVRQLSQFFPLLPPYLPEVESMIPLPEGDIFYRFVSAWPDSSPLHDSPVAVLYRTPTLANAIISFPLYAMQPYDSVKAFASEILEDIRAEIEEESPIPEAYALQQNYPNPFNPSTTINYQLPVDGQVTLRIFNICGGLVTSLDEGFRSAGFHRAMWKARGMASGVYLCRLEAGDFRATKKMILLK